MINHFKKHWVDIVHGPLLAWGILALSLLVTVAAWHISTKYVDQRAQDRFNFLIEEAEVAIQKRMLDYEQMLRGGVGLFDASNGNISREAWNKYVTALDIETHYPGVQGVGFSQWITADQLAKHIEEIKAEGFPDYTVKPSGERENYTSIIYLEPMDQRNIRAFGYDMFSNDIRREAMTRARDTGKSSLSGRVTLLQETNKDVQAGFLVYLPVYKNSTTTLIERREQLLGFVYSPFRANDLMTGILGSGSPELYFNIYDGLSNTTENLLYKSNKVSTPAITNDKSLNATHQLEISGRIWTISYTSSTVFQELNASSQPLVIAIGGIVIDVLLFFIILSLANLRKKAMALAEVTAQQLRARENHFKAITDTANDAIISADSHGKIFYVNKTAEKIFGYSGAEMLGQPITLLMPPRYTDQHNEHFNNFISSGISRIMGKNVEVSGLNKNGDEFPIEFSLSHWSMLNKRYINAIVRDITERKHIERMKSEFVSTVSHELRTPLTSVRGSLSLMSSGQLGEINQQMSGLLSIANKNIDRLGRLINDILDIEKIEAAHMDMNIQPHRVSDLLKNAIDDNSSFAQLSNVKLALELDIDHNVVITVDIDRFLQIMTNLIANAVKFSPSGETVVIRTIRRDAFIRIEVEDHGQGVPSEFHARIFSKFAQADSSDTRQKGGTGLGLSICKALIEKFEGTIDYTTTPGKGAVFYIELPIDYQARNLKLG